MHRLRFHSCIKAYKAYLMLERSLSENSIDAYIRDVDKLREFANSENKSLSPLNIQLEDLEAFILFINNLGLGERSQGRILSGIRSFFKFLMIEDLIDDDPSELLSGPKLQRKIPDVLSYEEINKILAAIDLSEATGQRNKAMLETLYSCGLRVSELIGLKISNLFLDLNFVRVIGKNNKERLIPIGDAAIKQIELYIEGVRRGMMNIQKGHEDILFLNRRGKQLSRVMIFHIVKKAVKDAGIDKNVSPHTFRHSFATHLVEGGANLRAVQDMLGHESIITTEIYTHLDTDYLRETILSHHPRNKRNF
ncbi:MAG: site-specific tyrosine recombinase XerD [Bacteroidota bacterium]